MVDGAKMANDTFKGVGWCMGFLPGWVLKKKYIGFTTDVPMISRVTRLTTGLLSFLYSKPYPYTIAQRLDSRSGRDSDNLLY